MDIDQWLIETVIRNKYWMHLGIESNMIEKLFNTRVCILWDSVDLLR